MAAVVQPCQVCFATKACSVGLWQICKLQRCQVTCAALPSLFCTKARGVGPCQVAMKGRVDWTNLQELFASCVRELWQTGWCSNRLSGFGIRGSGFGARGACQEAKLMRFFEQRNKSPLGFRVIGFQATFANASVESAQLVAFLCFALG